MPHLPISPDPLLPLVAPLERIGSFWLRTSIGVQVLLLSFFITFKYGLDIELRNIQEAYLPGSLLFPEPAGYFSASIGQVLFANLLAIGNTGMWVLAHAIMTIIALSIAFVLLIRNSKGQEGYSILVLAAATSVATMMIAIGKYDVFTFLGGIVLVLSRSNWVALFGALVMASGHPEVAILASVSLLLVTYIGPFREYRPRAVVSIMISSLIWVSVQIWFAVFGLDSGRIALVPKYLGESFSNFLVNPLAEIWSWIGVGWLIVLPVLVIFRGRERILAASALILIPSIATVVTADGARVFGGIVLPSYLLLGIWFALSRVQLSKYSRVAVGGFILALVLIPSSIDRPGWYDGQVRGTIITFTEKLWGI